MKQISCEIARDLMPLYIENLLRPGSREILEEHISACPSCQKEREILEEDFFQTAMEIEEPKAPSKFSFLLQNNIMKYVIYGCLLLGIMGSTELLQRVFHPVFGNPAGNLYFGILAIPVHNILFLILAILWKYRKGQKKELSLFLLLFFSMGSMGVLAGSTFPWYLVFGGYPVIVGGIIGYLMKKLKKIS